MRLSKPIVLGAAALLGLGITTAAAADSHADAVRAAVQAAKALMGDERGATISAVANTNGKARSAAAKADAIADKAARGDRDAHGDAMSSVATDHDATAAHSTGDHAVNHGGAVSAAAHLR